jgi:hypothetical protein
MMSCYFDHTCHNQYMLLPYSLPLYSLSSITHYTSSNPSRSSLPSHYLFPTPTLPPYSTRSVQASADRAKKDQETIERMARVARVNTTSMSDRNHPGELSRAVMLSAMHWMV